MFGEDLKKMADRKLQRQLEQKRLARDYQRWVMSNGMSAVDAQRFAPADVKKGMSLIRQEEKQVQKDAMHRQKERIAERFSVQGSGT